MGVEKGGVQSAEALLLARYFMFSQVYLHPVRRIYDILLKDFLCEWLENGKFSVDLESLLALSDSEIIAALRRLCDTPHEPGFKYANRIINRKHFKLLYERNPEDIAVNPDAAQAIYSAAVERFGVDKVKLDSYRMKGGLPNFPTILPDKSVVSALDLSETLRQLPGAAIDYVFIQPEILKQAERWLKKNRSDIIRL